MSSIQKGISELSDFRRTLPELRFLNLSTVKNSIVVCRVCRGTRLIAVESSVFHSYTFKKCLLCKGSGVMSNNEDTYNR